MSKTIKLCGNNLIEMASYRNPEVVFHNSENPRHLKPKYDDFESYCDFKEVIDPFVMYSENEKLRSIIREVKEKAEMKIKGYKEIINTLIYSSVENKRYEIAELKYRIGEQEELIEMLEGVKNE